MRGVTTWLDDVAWKETSPQPRSSTMTCSTNFGADAGSAEAESASSSESAADAAHAARKTGIGALGNHKTANAPGSPTR